MSLSAQFRYFIVEQMQGFAQVRLQPMFGGAAVKCDGLTFALLADDTLYLKVDSETLPVFDAESLPPFTYQTRNGPILIKGYRRAPLICLDDEAEMTRWCALAHAAALRAATHKARKPLKSPSRK